MSGFASLLPSLIGAGASVIPSLFGSSPQSKASDAIAKNIPGQIAKGNAATTTGLTNLNNAGNFYNTLLGGNKDALTSLLNPQVGTVLSQYDNAAKSVSRFAPRGGGATSTLAQLPFLKATAAGTAYENALPSAAQGAASVGSATGQIGTNLTGQATGYAPTGFDYKRLSGEQFGQLGSGFGKILAQLLTRSKTGTSGGLMGTLNDSGTGES